MQLGEKGRYGGDDSNNDNVCNNDDDDDDDHDDVTGTARREGPVWWR